MRTLTTVATLFILTCGHASAADVPAEEVPSRSTETDNDSSTASAS